MSDPANGHPRDRLSEYLDDELGLEERASVDRHLAGCEDCREELEALRCVARVLAEESVPPVPVDLEARIARRLAAAAVGRPKRWRFALPATIAATLGAIGILVALQWRGEGPVSVPTAPAPAPEPATREFDQATPANKPPPAVVPEQGLAPLEERAPARSDALEKDLAATPQQRLTRDGENAPAGAPAGVPGGVVGGVEGGVAPGSAGGPAGQVPSRDERRERVAAKAETRSLCGEHWSDSGLRATWDVKDVRSAAGELDRIARDVGGVGMWPGLADSRRYVLAVPRGRFEEVFFALRARGVVGLLEPPVLDPASDCASISIVLAVAAGSATPSPR